MDPDSKIINNMNQPDELISFQITSPDNTIGQCCSDLPVSFVMITKNEF